MSLRSLAGRSSVSSSASAYEGVCHCFACDEQKDSRNVSVIDSNSSGKPCAICKSVWIATTCSNKYRRCAACQLFCECFVCHGIVTKTQKSSIWKSENGILCGDCGISLLAVDCEEKGRPCFSCYIDGMKPMDSQEKQAQSILPQEEDEIWTDLNNSLLENRLVDITTDEDCLLLSSGVIEGEPISSAVRSSTGSEEFLSVSSSTVTMSNSTVNNIHRRTDAAAAELNAHIIAKRRLNNRGRKRKVDNNVAGAAAASVAKKSRRSSGSIAQHPPNQSVISEIVSAEELLTNSNLQFSRSNNSATTVTLSPAVSSLSTNRTTSLPITNSSMPPPAVSYRTPTPAVSVSDENGERILSAAEIADASISGSSKDGTFRSRSKQSIIWTYMEQIVCVDTGSGLQYNALRCLHCHAKIKYTSSTSGGLKHIKACSMIRKLFPGGLNQHAAEHALVNDDADEDQPGSLATSALSTSVGGTSTTSRLDLQQTNLSQRSDGSLSYHFGPAKDSAHTIRGMVAEMVIVDEQGFKLVDNEGLKHLVSFLRPDCKLLSRFTVREDTVNIVFPANRVNMKKFFKKLVDEENPFISTTTDIYTNKFHKKAYMAITVHFIMRKTWKLYSVLICFERLSGSHTGVAIAAKFDEVVTEFGIRDNIFSCTKDNAYNNDTMVQSISYRVRLQCDGRFFHTRCNAHIFNLIAQTGLELLKAGLKDLRTFIKCIRTVRGAELFDTILQRDRNFEFLVKKKRPILDVRTRWNATYDLIESVLPFSEIISKMSNEEFDGFDIDEVTNQLTQVRVKVPNFSRDFWHKLAQMRDFLKPLKEATVAVSAQLTPTAHVVIPHLEVICDQIDYIQPVERSFLESSADAMAVKYAEYFRDQPEVFMIAHMLDPRCKLQWVQMKTTPPILTNSTPGTQNLAQLYLSTIREVYEKYFKHHTMTSDNADQSMSHPSSSLADNASSNTTSSSTKVTSVKERFQAMSTLHRSQQSSSARDIDELEKYLQEEVEEDQQGFDILQYWQRNSSRFPTLSVMAAAFLGNFNSLC
jgi:hypothetical protein